MTAFRPDGCPALSPHPMLDDPQASLSFAEALFGAVRLRILRNADVFARALEIGAQAVQEPRHEGDPDYRGGFRDPGGITWWVAQQTEEN